MELDQTTYADLSIFHPEEEFSLFHKLNFARTIGGREYLRRIFLDPTDNLPKILATQQVIKLFYANIDNWPMQISNGTLMVMDRYFESPVDTLPKSKDPVNAFFFRIFHLADYSLVRFSVPHFREFLEGMYSISILFDSPDTPALLKEMIDKTQKILKNAIATEIIHLPKNRSLSVGENLFYGNFFRERFRVQLQDLIQIYYRIDAWYSMAMAVKTYNLSFPDFINSHEPRIHASGLYHILLGKPVAYDLGMSPQSNFLFLTGANMAGKSTFIKAAGAAVFLAHLGMGVPAKSMQLTLFDGMLSNINVMDNIIKGESYFFNEVQRIKKTIQTINNGKKWLVLIDELFKGTNVEDAMKCSLTVIKGLVKIRRSLFILSTHLYEIGDELKPYPNISFRFFETQVMGDQLQFSYQLKEGISNDRLGYLILKKEKVVEMLEKL